MNLMEALENRGFRPGKLKRLLNSKTSDAISSWGSALATAAAVGLGGGGAAVVVATIGVAVVVSVINALQKDSREKDLLDFYRDQIAAIKGLDEPAHATVRDLHDFAEGRGDFQAYGPNAVAKGEIDNYQRRLNASFASHTIATGGVAALAVAFMASPAIGNVLSAVGAGLGALAIYHPIDQLIEGAQGLFSRNTQTAHRSLQALEDTLHNGQHVTPLQVYSALVKVIPGEGARIEKEYGTNFDDLYLSQKRAALRNDARRLNVGGITRGLNAGRLEADDLALFSNPVLPLDNAEVSQRLAQFRAIENVEQNAVMGASSPVAVVARNGGQVPVVVVSDDTEVATRFAERFSGQRDVQAQVARILQRRMRSEATQERIH
jgi:hypothetical protein